MRESQELGHKISSHVTKHGKGVCTACGNVLLPQWTVRSKITAKKARPSRRVLKAERVMRRMVRSQRCSFCDRVTKDASAIGSSLRKEKKQPAEAAQPSEDMMSADTVVEGTNKSSSKKRAKARKDREGLQALLKKSVQTKTLPSLNLMDLMKK
jgi:PP-loop superfamily ATP-utilizing enzyme